MYRMLTNEVAKMAEADDGKAAVMARMRYGWAKIRGAYRRSRRRWLCPQRKGFPIGGGAHAAKNERRCCLEQVAATVFPFGFGANNAHAVGAERKDCECRSVSERRLAVKAFDERRKLRIASNLP